MYSSMGHVIVEAELSWTKKEKVRMLVDTGATHTVLPADVAKRLGVIPSPRRLRVRLADGSTRAMRIGSVLVRLLGREAGDTVLIGPKGAEPLLGVEALEGLGLTVDPRSRKLRATRGHGAMLVGVLAGSGAVRRTRRKA
jgi:clan AA aspartic protease